MEQEGTLDRMERQGIRSLGATDLLAIVFSPNREDVSEREVGAKRWMSRRKLHAVGDLCPADFPALGLPIENDWTMTRILAALELGRKSGLARQGQIDTVSGPTDAIRLFEHLAHEKQEHFCAAFLNSKNGVIAQKTIHIGTLNSSLVGIREVFREAVREGAAGIIVAHNHPSGDPEPSPEDIQVTAKLNEAGKLLGVDLLDHIIIGDPNSVSLRKRGLL